MSSQGQYPEDRGAILAEVKKFCGPRIEDHRLLKRMSQARLAGKVGVGVRWLREIEMGSATPHLDDYIRCAHGVGLSSAHVLIPILFLEHRRQIPKRMFFEEIYEVEQKIIDLIQG